jgi:hypothetical protein
MAVQLFAVFVDIVDIAPQLLRLSGNGRQQRHSMGILFVLPSKQGRLLGQSPIDNQTPGQRIWARPQPGPSSMDFAVPADNCISQPIRRYTSVNSTHSTVVRLQGVADTFM